MRQVIRVLVAVLFIWVLGFGFFLGRLPDAPQPGIKAGAIVVLTGGAGRIEAGAQLLEQGAAPQLFISGVHDVANPGNIPGLQALPAALLGCCVTLGRKAHDTWGNATEIAETFAQKGPGSLVLVTADYHMPRAVMLVRWHNPDLFIIPYRVETPLAPFYLLMEYHKFIATMVRLMVTDQPPQPYDVD